MLWFHSPPQVPAQMLSRPVCSQACEEEIGRMECGVCCDFIVHPKDQPSGCPDQFVPRHVKRRLVGWGVGYVVIS